jgi:hypothetical protein
LHFWWTELAGKLATSLGTSWTMTPSNIIGICKVCKLLSSLQQCDRATQHKISIDSAVIYPITHCPTNTLRSVEEKGYTFSLHISLDLDDNALGFL